MARLCVSRLFSPILHNDIFTAYMPTPASRSNTTPNLSVADFHGKVDVEITSFQDDEDDSPPLSAPIPRRKRTSPPTKLPSPPYSIDGRYTSEQLNFNTAPIPPPAQASVALPQTTETRIQRRYPFIQRQISPVHRLSTYTISPVADLPIYHLPYVAGILDNYMSKLGVPFPELDDNSPRPLIRTVWFPMVMHSPAIFRVIVLLSSAYYAVYARPAEYPRFYTQILYLKQLALQGLMIDLQNVQVKETEQYKPRIPSIDSSATSSAESNVPSDQAPISPPNSGIVPAVNKSPLTNFEEECLIAAIAKMASYEAIFGDKESYHTHMLALTSLLRRRPGGLASLGQDGLLSRLLRFIDTNSAFLLGTNLYLADDDGVGVCLPRHYPFKAKRFSEMEAQGVKPGDVLMGRTEGLCGGEGGTAAAVDKERFVGLCGTGDALRF